MITRILKFVWRKWGVRQAYLNNKLNKRIREWKKVELAVTPHADLLQKKVLIIPSDPHYLSASTGDQAMISAIVDYWSDKIPGCQFFVACSGEPAIKAANELGFTPIRSLDASSSIEYDFDVISRELCSHVIVMGADVLDGSYNPEFSGRNLILADLLSRHGSDVTITGFSVSENFHGSVVEIFKQMHPRVRINVRDPVSFKRFTSKCGNIANEVADIAFLLKPIKTSNTALVTEKLDNLSKDKLLIGINIHPLLLELEERSRVTEFIEAFSRILLEVVKRDQRIVFVILEHDRRGTSSDVLCLKPLFEKLQGTLSERVIYPDENFSAPEVKYLVQFLDGVVTGRMHLMIACLGVGVPTFGLEYKAKMQGLLDEMDLTDSLVPAKMVLDQEDLVTKIIGDFVLNLPLLKERVGARTVAIKSKSAKNFGDF
jgi:polysaccharide pyruvyl transferase WcaK-like protein